MAHRGNSARCPENTMAAFRMALEDGADAIETDLHLAADGTFMCIHDATVDRTTDGSGAVRSMTREALQSLSAGYGRPEFAGERIPTLRALLGILPPDVFLGLELKSDDFRDRAACLGLRDLLAETGVLGRAFAISFSEARLEAVRRFAPELPTGLITVFRPLPPRRGEFAGPLWPITLLNPFYVALAHRRRQLVCPLDPAPEPRLWYYRALGCDVVLSNDPGLTRRKLGRTV
jgi:glycerophosphoryl diester phosphodiesterase